MRVLGRLALGLHNDPPIPHIYQNRVSVPHCAYTNTVPSRKHMHTHTFRRPPTPAVSLVAFLTSPRCTSSSHSTVITLRQSDIPDSTSRRVCESEWPAASVIFKSLIVLCVWHQIATADSKNRCGGGGRLRYSKDISEMSKMVKSLEIFPRWWKKAQSTKQYVCKYSSRTFCFCFCSCSLKPLQLSLSPVIFFYFLSCHIWSGSLI